MTPPLSAMFFTTFAGITIGAETILAASATPLPTELSAIYLAVFPAVCVILAAICIGTTIGAAIPFRIGLQYVSSSILR